MRFFYGFLLAVLVAAALWAKLSCIPSDTKPNSEKPQGTAPAEPPVAETPSPFTEDYEAAMKETERKVILIFSSDKCPTCEVLNKTLKEMDLKGFLVCTVDADKHGDICKKHDVKRLPTSIMIEKGKEIDRTKVLSKVRYKNWLSENR